MSNFPSENTLMKHNTSLLNSEISVAGYSSVTDYEFFENFQSDHTKMAYKRDLIQFFNFLNTNFKGEITSPRHIHKMHVLAFRNALSASKSKTGKSCCPKTIIRKLASITSYCNFMIEKGFMSVNPTTHIKRPVDQVIHETNDLTDQEVSRLINSVDLSKKSGMLHKAILVLLFSTGIRKGELINLKIDDYQETQGLKVIQYIGKRGKITKTPLHPVAVYHLEAYLSFMREHGFEFKNGDYLFQSLKGRGLNKKLQPTSIDYIVKSHAEKIGLKSNISPHSARATVIGSLLQSGCDLYKVSQLVNHSNVKTTQSYDKRKKSLIDSPVFKIAYL